MNLFNSFTFLFLSSIFTIVLCLPTENVSEINPEFKDEKRYPNGTVVGKYIYKDKEGNPVHVQYYADDNSYGVELKSVKVLNEAEPKDLDFFAKTMSTPFKLASDLLNIKYVDFDKVEDPSQTTQTNKIDNIKSKDHFDYETLYSKDYKKNGKEKIRIYSEKAKRKTRNALDYDTILL